MLWVINIFQPILSYFEFSLDVLSIFNGPHPAHHKWDQWLQPATSPTYTIQNFNFDCTCSKPDLKDYASFGDELHNLIEKFCPPKTRSWNSHPTKFPWVIPGFCWKMYQFWRNDQTLVVSKLYFWHTFDPSVIAESIFKFLQDVAARVILLKCRLGE